MQEDVCQEIVTLLRRLLQAGLSSKRIERALFPLQGLEGAKEGTAMLERLRFLVEQHGPLD